MKLDSVLSPDEQKEWLASDLVVLAPPAGRLAQMDGEAGSEALAALRQSPHWPELGKFLRRYIEACIPAPFETEAIWWSLTIPKGREFIRLNISFQEVMTISIDGRGVLGHFIVSKSAIYRKRNSFPEWVEDKVSPYVFGGKDQIWLTCDPSPTGSMLELIENATFIRAAREFNLSLMRRGETPKKKAHSGALVRTLFENASAGDGVENDEPGSPTLPMEPMDTLILREVWARKYMHVFAPPVKTRWGGRCAISGIEAAEVLDACHILPWARCSEPERLDPENGICLAAHLHRAFDAHLFAFTVDGRIEVSNRLNADDRRLLGLDKVVMLTFGDAQKRFVERRLQLFRAYEMGPSPPGAPLPH